MTKWVPNVSQLEINRNEFDTVQMYDKIGDLSGCHPNTSTKRSVGTFQLCRFSLKKRYMWVGIIYTGITPPFNFQSFWNQNFFRHCVHVLLVNIFVEFKKKSFFPTKNTTSHTCKPTYTYNHRTIKKFIFFSNWINGHGQKKKKNNDVFMYHTL